MTETNGAAAETTPKSELRSRGNVSDVAALIAGESNAAAEEIERRQADGDPLLADVNLELTEPEPDPATTTDAPDPDEAKFLNPDGEQDAPKPDEDPAKTPEPITSFKQLAEAAGLELSALYDLTIAFGDGQGVDAEPVKLGAIKDAYQKGTDLDARAADLETEQSNFEQNKLLTNQAIDSRIASMNLDEAQIREQGAWVAQNKLLEQQKLFQVVPELAKNATLREQTHQEIVSLVEPYGISAIEVDNIVDHRFYKFAMDAVKAFELIATARADAKRVRKTATGRGVKRKLNGKGDATSGTDKLVAQAKSTRVQGDQVAAISALLGAKHG